MAKDRATPSKICLIMRRHSKRVQLNFIRFLYSCFGEPEICVTRESVRVPAAVYAPVRLRERHAKTKPSTAAAAGIHSYEMTILVLRANSMSEASFRLGNGVSGTSSCRKAHSGAQPSLTVKTNSWSAGPWLAHWHCVPHIAEQATALGQLCYVSPLVAPCLMRSPGGSPKRVPMSERIVFQWRMTPSTRGSVTGHVYTKT